MFDYGELLGGIVDIDEIEKVDFNPSGLTETKKASKISGHIMGEVMIWGLTNGGLKGFGPCDLWGQAHNVFVQEPNMEFWIQAVRKSRRDGSCMNYPGLLRSAPKRGYLYAKSSKHGNFKENSEYSPENYIKVGKIQFKGNYRKNKPNNPLREGLISDLDAVISIDVKKNKIRGAIYNANNWLEKLDGSSGMPSAKAFKSTYKDDIIGSIKINKKAFLKADVESFEGINGLLGADVFG